MLPAAIAGSSVAGFLYRAFVQFNLWLEGINPESDLSYFFRDAGTGFVMGGAIVYIAVRVAPSYKKRVGIVLAAVILVASGFLMAGSVLADSWTSLAGGVTLAVGASLTAYYTYLEV